MSRTGILIVLGALVILAPYSGLPIMARNLLELVFGALVLSIGLWMRSKEVRRSASSSPEPQQPTPEELLPKTAVSAEEPASPPHGVSPI